MSSLILIFLSFVVLGGVLICVAEIGKGIFTVSTIKAFYTQCDMGKGMNAG